MVKIELPYKVAENLVGLMQNPIEGYHPNSEPSYVREMRQVVFEATKKGIENCVEDEREKLEEQFLHDYEEMSNPETHVAIYYGVTLNKLYSALTGGATINEAHLNIENKTLELIYASGRERTIELD